jgi:hypothetical protein
MKAIPSSIPTKHLLVLSSLIFFGGTLVWINAAKAPTWQSKYLTVESNGKITYHPDAQGNTIPDFSEVGYASGNQPLPTVAVVKTIQPPTDGFSDALIQGAIDEVSSRKPNAAGHRGTILLKKGTYKLSGTLKIQQSGVVLRGEGNEEGGTKLISTYPKQHSFLQISGAGNPIPSKNTRTKITTDYVPVGATKFQVASVNDLKIGDTIHLFRPGTDQWISDLKMNQIVPKADTKQWTANGYNLTFERVIRNIQGKEITIDHPVVMAMEKQYGGGEIYKISFPGRLSEVGVENILFESSYASDTDEEHGWNAITFDKITNGWVKNVTSKYYGYSCVSLYNGARNISVLFSQCLDAKSKITGGRRYSFNNNGQFNLFYKCATTEGRHDYVTGAKIGGPNVFAFCTARQTHGDTGPHHRWAMGTLYDNIDTDGEINVRDRGNSGTGHGWAGVNQVLWNCKVKSAVVENPWISGKNYAIGIVGQKLKNKVGERPDGEWEGNNEKGLVPASLYAAQMKAKGKKLPD